MTVADKSSQPVRLSPLRQAYEDSQVTIRDLMARAMHRSPDGGFSIALSRDSKGITKPEVTVRQCDEFPTLASCEAAVIDTYERLRARYPLPSGYVGAEGGSLMGNPAGAPVIPQDGMVNDGEE